MFYLISISMWVINIHLGSEALQFVNHINYFTIANIRTVFFKRNPQYQDIGFIYWQFMLRHKFNHTIGDMNAHIVIDAPSRQNHLRCVANAFCFVSKVIGIDPDAVTSNQAWFEWQKVPFSTCCLQYFMGINAYLFEDKC